MAGEITVTETVVAVNATVSPVVVTVTETPVAVTVTNQGVQGSTGSAGQINSVTATTLPAGSSATVVNNGSTTNAQLVFGIPTGATGATGQGVPTGGTTGQALVKIDGTNYNTQWTTLSTTPSGSAGGDLSGTYPNPNLATLSPAPTGTYGSASTVPVVTVDSKGRTTSVTPTSIAIASGAVSGLAASATTDTTNASNITSGTLPNGRLSSIPNGALANSSVTINGSNVSLGNSVTVSATPTAHASTHGVAGSDPITIAESQVTNLTTDLAGKAATGQTMYIGTTATTINRASGSQSLTGVSIDGSSGSTTGNAATATNLAATTTTLASNVTASSLTSFGTSPALTGTPTTPTAAVDTNTTQVASTAFVVGQGYAKTSSLAASATTDTTNASNISSGTLANARTTATDANTPSAIVSRDGSGNFSAGQVTTSGVVSSGQVTATTTSTAPFVGKVTGSFSKSVTSGTIVTQVATFTVASTTGFYGGQTVTGSGFANTALNISFTVASFTNTTVTMNSVSGLSGTIGTGTLTANGTTSNLIEFQDVSNNVIGGINGSGGINTKGSIVASGSSSTSTLSSSSLTVSSVAGTATILPLSLTISGVAGTTTVAASGFTGSGAGLTTGTIPATALVGTDIATVGTITAGAWNAQAIPVLYGGTGANTATNARANLGAAPTVSPTFTGVVTTPNIRLSNGAPSVQSGTTYTVTSTNINVVLTSATQVTLTLPTATAGTEIRILCQGAGGVISASSNVYPKTSRTLGTAIIAATGSALLVGDGTNWQVML